MLESPDGDQRSSLLQACVCYWLKWLYNIRPRCRCYKTFSSSL